MKTIYWIIFLPLLLSIIFAILIYFKTKEVEKRALSAKKRQNEYRRQLELKQQMMAQNPQNPDD